MDTETLLLSWAAATATILLACMILARFIRSRLLRFLAGAAATTQQELGKATGEADIMLRALRAERGRAMAFIRHGTGPFGSDLGQDQDGDQDDDQADANRTPAWWESMIQGAGLNLERLKAGDPAEIQRALPMAQKLIAQLQASPLAQGALAQPAAQPVAPAAPTHAAPEGWSPSWPAPTKPMSW